MLESFTLVKAGKPTNSAQMQGMGKGGISALTLKGADVLCKSSIIRGL